MQGKELENFSINGKNWKWKILGKELKQNRHMYKGKACEEKSWGKKIIIKNKLIIINMHDVIRKACA